MGGGSLMRGFKQKVHRKTMFMCVWGGGAGIPTLSLELGYLTSSRAMMVVQSWTGDTVSYEAASHTFAWGGSRVSVV